MSSLGDLLLAHLKPNKAEDSPGGIESAAPKVFPERIEKGNKEETQSNASSTDDYVRELLDPDDRPRNVWHVVEGPKLLVSGEEPHKLANEHDQDQTPDGEPRKDSQIKDDHAINVHQTSDLDDQVLSHDAQKIEEEHDDTCNDRRSGHRDRSKERSSRRHHHHDGDRDHGGDHDRDRNRGRDRDRNRSRSNKDRDSTKDRGRDRDRNKSRDHDTDRVRSHDREKIRERERDRDRSRDRDRNRENYDSHRDSSRHRSVKRRQDYSDEEGANGDHDNRSRKDRIRSHSRSKASSSSRRRERSRSESLSPITKRNSRTILIMQLNPKVDSRDLEEFFSDVGKVREVRLIMDSKTRKHKGIAYIEFEDAASAQKAFALNGQKFFDAPIVIQSALMDKHGRSSGEWHSSSSSHTANKVPSSHSNSRSNLPPNCYRIHVGSLHPNLTDDMLRSVFEPFGPILRLELMRDRVTNVSRGYAFITYESVEDGQNAVQSLDGLELGGKPIRVSKSTDKISH